jgi:glycosyltransferase involved in cell wall biosynthesis
MAEFRVLQLIDGLNIGGAEMALLDLAEGLRAHGYRVHIGYSSPGPLEKDFRERNFEITRLPRLARVDPLLFNNIYRLIRRFRPQIVHTHLFKSDFHGRIAARLAGVPIVVSTLHSTDRWARKFPFGRLYGRTARSADRLIAVSDDLSRFHQQHSHIPAKKFVIIENGVALKKYAFSQPTRNRLRQFFHIGTEEILFGIIGRLTPPKDHETFLQAAALIQKEIPQARFLIVGDGALRPKLTQRAAELGLQKTLQFSGFRSDIPEILSALDVLVFSSQWEGLPLTLLEGMAAARPIVATAVGGIPAVTDNGKTAVLVPPRNPAGLARACIELATDSKRRLALGQIGLKRVQEKYSLQVSIERTLSLYETLLQEKGLWQ